MKQGDISYVILTELHLISLYEIHTYPWYSSDLIVWYNLVEFSC